MTHREYLLWVYYLSQGAYDIDTKQDRLLMAIAREVRQTHSSEPLSLEQLKIVIDDSPPRPTTKKDIAAGLLATKQSIFFAVGMDPKVLQDK